jgi:transcription-repair coupling factor (superfamily II helicase)
MRDLEIRGAGSILGARQSGHLSAVGYDMYLQLLNQAVSEQKGDVGADLSVRTESIIDVKMDAFIPEDYISSAAQRISCYKRIAEIRSAEDALDVTDELIDRYGEPLAPVAGLIEAAQVRNMAGEAGIREILQDNAVLKIFTEKPDMEGVSRAVGALGDRVALDFTAKAIISIKLVKGEEPLKTARAFLEAYAGD